MIGWQFYGSGKYSGGEYGSPVITMNIILNHPRFRPNSISEMVFLFIDNDKSRSAILTQTLSEIIGYRKINGRIITQPNCHKCRAILSKNPTRRTGPNNKKMVKSSLLIGNFQTKLD